MDEYHEDLAFDADLTGVTFPWIRAASWLVFNPKARFQTAFIITTMKVITESPGLPDRWWVGNQWAEHERQHYTHLWMSGDSIRQFLAANARPS